MVAGYPRTGFSQQGVPITKKCTRVADRAFPDGKSLGRNRVILNVIRNEIIDALQRWIYRLRVHCMSRALL